MGVVKGILSGSVSSPSSQTYIYMTHRCNHDHHQDIFVKRPTRVFTDENFARFFPCTKSAPRALDGFVFIIIIRSSIYPPLPPRCATMVVYRWGRRGTTQFCKLSLSFFWSCDCVYVALSCNLISTYSAVKNTIILLMIKRQRESPVVAHPTWGFPRATQASVNRPDDDDDDGDGDDLPI